MAAAAIIYAIRRTPAAEGRERVPIRLQVRPVLRGGLGRLFAGVTRVRGRQLRRDAAHPARHRAARTRSRPGHGDDHRPRPVRRLQRGRHRSRASPPAASPIAARARSALVFGVAAFAVAYLGFTRDVTRMVGAAAVVRGRRGRHRLRRDRRARRRRRRTHPTSCAARRSGSSPACRASATSRPAPSPGCCGRRSARPGRSPTSPRGCSLALVLSAASPGRPPWQRRRPYLRSPAQARAGTPRLSRRARTRWPISSRMGRTASTLCPAGSSSSQSS